MISITAILVMGFLLPVLFLYSPYNETASLKDSAQPEDSEARTRAENYSFSISINETEHVLYLEPGRVKEMELEIINTGEKNDSYTVGVSSVGDTWSHMISHSRSPILASQEDFSLKLNVTAPIDLFLYPRECVFEIRTASVNRSEITNNITLLLIAAIRHHQPRRRHHRQQQPLFPPPIQ